MYNGEKPTVTTRVLQTYKKMENVLYWQQNIDLCGTANLLPPCMPSSLTHIHPSSSILTSTCFCSHCKSTCLHQVSYMLQVDYYTVHFTF